MQPGTTGTFTANHRSRKKDIRTTHDAMLLDGPDAEGNCTFRIQLPVGHPDKPKGGSMLIHAPPGAFKAD